MKNLRTSAVYATVLAATSLVFSNANALAQEAAAVAPASVTSEGTANAVRDLQEQVRQLRTMVDEMHSENVQSRAEMQQLRQELQATRNFLERTPAGNDSAAASAGSRPPASGPTSSAQASNNQAAAPAPSALEDRVQKLEESTSLIGSKIDEHYQTKVETASKYRARLSGIVLMNAFRNVGASNSLDFPDFAQPVPDGSSLATFGATLRQSEIGLEIFGPNIRGAKSSANVQLDFAGGFPATGNAVNFGFVRLQTASLRLDWEHTSIVAGQDSLFISPLSPTSFASLATPTFGFAGNLWGWTPQLRVEHRFNFSDRQTLTVQGGILDNLNWEFPYAAFYRPAQAGEQSGQPAYAARTSWSRPVLERPLSFGVAGYYGRQNWTWGRYVDAWAGMADWQIPVLSRLTLSGEFYRGRGIGGLGAGIGRSVVFGGPSGDPASPIHGLDSIGGWAQVKFQLTSRLELNGTFAQDNAYAHNVRGFATDQDNSSQLLGQNNVVPILGRNRGLLGNFVYRPRSDLLFSAELRRLHTFPVYSSSSVTNQLNLAMGILF